MGQWGIPLGMWTGPSLLAFTMSGFSYDEKGLDFPDARLFASWRVYTVF